MVEAEMVGRSDSLCRAGSTKWVVVSLLLARYMVLGPCLQAPQSELSPEARKLCVQCASTSRVLYSVLELEYLSHWLIKWHPEFWPISRSLALASAIVCLGSKG